MSSFDFELNQSQVIFGTALGASNLFFPINAPQRAKGFFIELAGAGGAGGNGFTGASSGGGGGGGSSALTVGDFRLEYLTNTLWLRIGNPGATSGTLLAIEPVASADYTILKASGPTTTGGAGVSGTAGSGGVAGAAMVAADAAYSSRGLWSSIIGQAGVAGSTNADAGAIVWGATGTYLCGAPGGGGNVTSGRAGGGVTGAGWVPTIAGGTGAPTPTDGNPGMYQLSNFISFFVSGSGGGGATSVIGGNGQKGSPGCGGSGGGAGTTGGTGGAGGNGFAIITFY